MPNHNRDEIRSIILKRIGNRVKKNVLDKNIEGLIDEYIEKHEFILKNGISVKDNPTKEQIKWWFQDRFDESKMESNSSNYEEPLEIQVDEICLTDPVALIVFKYLYKFKYKQGDEVPNEIKALIKLIKLSELTKNAKSKTTIKRRLNNIAIVGVIRFYRLERKPYLYPSQINKAINYFKNVLLLIDKVSNNETKDIEDVGELVVFEALKDDPKNKDNKKK